jgi:hypothetical protein
MSKNYYRDILEALSMRKKKRIVYGKLNEASIHSDDERLRILAKEAMDGLIRSGTNTELTPLIKFRYVDTNALQRLCEEKAYL